MANKSAQNATLNWVKTQLRPFSIHEIPGQVPERTLRRWLSEWVAQGVLQRTGAKRSTRYQYRQDNLPPFLQQVPQQYRSSLLKQLRDLWTHTSTALEGNTLTLGDTHFILEEGLTISGKPLQEHQEVVGHARAIELVYQGLAGPLTEQRIFDLHRAVQTEVVTDIYKPNGAWKNEVNGTYVVTPDNQQVFIEYAAPSDVPPLMKELIAAINTAGEMSLDQAAHCYARIHAGFVHIHPFWDGNGRLARLLANIPLLKSGLPPLVIPLEERRAYIQLLAEYEIGVGQLNRRTGVWPNEAALADFSAFCVQQYSLTMALLEKYSGQEGG
ncbi:Fic family protein [Alcanivorax sp.]|uniref:Fic family protein n=1 Tax=Alcanivorax sp. TaxID=1872427 RepID=UPI003A90020C